MRVRKRESRSCEWPDFNDRVCGICDPLHRAQAISNRQGREWTRGHADLRIFGSLNEIETTGGTSLLRVSRRFTSTSRKTCHAIGPSHS